MDSELAAPPPERAEWTRELQRRLLAWFRRHARDLPWRRTTDVYAVWISEIMLQQTQVATVVPYFQRFLAAFPTVEDLASAPEHDVLRCWEGLGYYRRARQLHRAAQVIVQQHGGQFPARIEDVLRLPGIGRYTAGAILSIAQGQRLPILEANTVRLYSRLMLLDRDPTQSAAQKQLWEFAESILPRRSVGTFNQALMELGSTVCTPRQPRCSDCPLVTLCPTAERGWQQRIPVPKRRAAYEDLRQAAIVILHRSRVLLRQCGPDERWAGLWDFPRFSLAADANGSLPRQLEAHTQQLTGVRIRAGEHLTTLRHGVTRYRITLECYTAQWLDQTLPPDRALRWVGAEELKEYPLSVTGRKLAETLRQQMAASGQQAEDVENAF